MANPPADLPGYIQALLSFAAALAVFVGAIWGYVRKGSGPPAREGEAMLIAGAIADKASVDRLVTALENLEVCLETVADVVRHAGDRNALQADRIHAVSEKLHDAVDAQAAATTNLLNFILHRH